MSARPPADKQRELRHRRLVIVGLVLLLAAFVAVMGFVQRANTAFASVSLHTITALNIVLLLVLLFVLGRNVIKLYVERRQQKLGSQFSTRVVVTYIGMALVPTVLLFIAASNLIRTSVDRWFSTTTTDLVMRSREVARESIEHQEEQLLAAARQIAGWISDKAILHRDTRLVVLRDVTRQRPQLDLDAVSVYEGDHLLLEPVLDPESPLVSEISASVAGDEAILGPPSTARPTPAPVAGADPATAPAAGVAATGTGDDPVGPAADDAGSGARRGDADTGGAASGDLDGAAGGVAQGAAGDDPEGAAGAGSEPAGVAEGAAGATAAGAPAGPEELPVPPLPDSHPLAVPPAQLALALQGQPFRLTGQLPGNRMLVLAGAPVPASRDAEGVAGVVVVARVMPEDLISEVDAIEGLYRAYMQDLEQKDPITTTYLLIFLLMTLLIIFSALWVGLYLARGVTVPIQKLAQATRAVASGDLDYRVEVQARDELGMLVHSFNQMTVDLRAGQEKLQTSRDTLQKTNTELEDRRRYMEAVLANIATGVVSLNAEGRITTFNRAAERMLSMDGAAAVSHAYHEVFGDDSFGDLRELMDRAKTRRAPVEQELTIEANGSRLTVAAHCSSLRDAAGAYMGTVIVLDDLTDLIKAQKAAAWREVARRIAHEIRNPLTPIQLSAQRIARRYRRAVGAEGQYDVIEEGTRTILQEVDTLKGLVSEFSRYARMPTVSLVPAALNDILEASLLSCASMHDGITVERDFDPDLPGLRGDPDQLKRAFTNLIDNAVEAMEGRGTLRVRTAFDAEVETVRVEIADTGPGIRAEDKDKLFLPYFSRKRDGTGLGLAIVHQIVADHRGYVRVADHHPRGTVFIVELPR